MNAIYLIRVFETVLPQHGFFTEEDKAYEFVAGLEADRRKRNPFGVTGNVFTVVPVIGAVQHTSEVAACQPA